MNTPPYIQTIQAILIPLLISSIPQICHTTLSTYLRHLAQPELAQQRQTNLHQDQNLAESLMRFLRSRSEGRLHEAANTTLAPTAAELDEFLRQATSLREEMQDCAERVSAALHARDPPPRYSTVASRSEQTERRSTASTYGVSRIPVPIRRDSRGQISLPPMQTDLEGLAATRTAHDIIISYDASRVLNASLHDTLMLTERDISAVITQLYQIFFESHPDMPIQQARYYARSLRSAMIPHISSASGTEPIRPGSALAEETRFDSASEAPSMDGIASMNEALTMDGDISLDENPLGGEPLCTHGDLHTAEPITRHIPEADAADVVQSTVASSFHRSSTPEVLPLDQSFSNGVDDTAHPASTSAHVSGLDSPESVASSGGSSDETLVNSSSDGELPVILVFPPPSPDHNSDNDLPTVEIHLPARR